MRIKRFNSTVCGKIKANVIAFHKNSGWWSRGRSKATPFVQRLLFGCTGRKQAQAAERRDTNDRRKSQKLCAACCDHYEIIGQFQQA
jgi:hypothetical protein